MNIFLGFDPGGINNFGWCVCEDANDLSIITVRTHGIASHAAEAVNNALAALDGEDNIVGVGIDAPMFWRADGDRLVDIIVRNAIQQIGAAAPAGTVQSVNSLRGACVIQGIITGVLLRKRFPDVQITESHPKAMLWLLDHANAPNPVLSPFLGQEQFEEEHVRDAALGALCAWAMINEPQGWQNLFPHEHDPILPVSGTISYWMPLIPF